MHGVEKQEILSPHQKNISSNQLFCNLFSKTITFTKFLPKMRDWERIPWFPIVAILTQKQIHQGQAKVVLIYFTMKTKSTQMRMLPQFYLHISLFCVILYYFVRMNREWQIHVSKSQQIESCDMHFVQGVASQTRWK